MRLVYFDEAGISNPDQEPFVVVGGIIVHGDAVLNGVKARLEQVLVRHIPEGSRSGFIFHAMELFNGGGIFKRYPIDFIGPIEWPLSRRLAIARELARVVKKFRLPVALGWVERAKFPLTFSIPENWTEANKTVAAHVSAYMTSAMVAEQWMRRNAPNENCLMVVEDNAEARKHIREVQTYHQDRKIEPLLDEKSRKHFPLRKIQEDPLFQPKRQSNPLILADFCAYVFKRILMKDERYAEVFDLWREEIIVLDL